MEICEYMEDFHPCLSELFNNRIVPYKAYMFMLGSEIQDGFHDMKKLNIGS